MQQGLGGRKFSAVIYTLSEYQKIVYFKDLLKGLWQSVISSRHGAAFRHIAEEHAPITSRMLWFHFKPTSKTTRIYNMQWPLRVASTYSISKWQTHRCWFSKGAETICYNSSGILASTSSVSCRILPELPESKPMIAMVHAEPLPVLLKVLAEFLLVLPMTLCKCLCQGSQSFLKQHWVCPLTNRVFTLK